MKDPMRHKEAGRLLDKIKFDSNGLVPAIVQDFHSKQVLMLAYMNREALKATMETGKTHFYSRSRKSQWLKGETSGHIQEVVAMCFDCDNDTVLILAKQTGGACHTGYYSCFFSQWDDRGGIKIVGEKVFDPDKTYP